MWLPDGSDLRFSLYAASNNFRMNPCGCGSGFGSRMKSAPWKRGQTHSSVCLTVLQIGSCLCWRYLITSSKKKKKMQLFSFLFFFFVRCRNVKPRTDSHKHSHRLRRRFQTFWTRCQTDRITSEQFSVHRPHVDVFKSSSVPPRVPRTFSPWDTQLQDHAAVYNI